MIGCILMNMSEIILIVHDMRSAHNVGSLLRTAECLGVHQVIFTGYSPHPPYANDARLPHIASKLGRQINKTALGAEDLVTWSYEVNPTPVINRLRVEGYTIVALEQSPESVDLPDYTAPEKICLLLGREVEGIEPRLLALCDDIIEIPQQGQKESLNVVQATAIALFELTNPRIGCEV